MAKIFISYSSKDGEFVKQLSYDLLAGGLPVWLDIHELSLGDSLYGEIFQAIKGSSFIIIVLSTNYGNSIWTSKEFKAILSQEDKTGKKYIIPIKIDSSDVPLVIADRIFQDFCDDYAASVRKLVRFFKKEDLSIKLLPLEDRQIILNFDEHVELDVDLLKNCLVDYHLHGGKLVTKGQIFFGGYSEIDRLLALCDTNVASAEQNAALKKQFKQDKAQIENLIGWLLDGAIMILNDYDGMKNIEMLSTSIYWFSRIIMDSVYSLLCRYIFSEQLADEGLSHTDFSYFPTSNSLSFGAFYRVEGYRRLDIWNPDDEKECFTVSVDDNCYAYQELSENPLHMTFSEAFSSDLVYKYFLPQNVFSRVLNGDKGIFLKPSRRYLVGLS